MLGKQERLSPDLTVEQAKLSAGTTISVASLETVLRNRGDQDEERVDGFENDSTSSSATADSCLSGCLPTTTCASVAAAFTIELDHIEPSSKEDDGLEPKRGALKGIGGGVELKCCDSDAAGSKEKDEREEDAAVEKARSSQFVHSLDEWLRALEALQWALQTETAGPGQSTGTGGGAAQQAGEEEEQEEEEDEEYAVKYARWLKSAEELEWRQKTTRMMQWALRSAFPNDQGGAGQPTGASRGATEKGRGEGSAEPLQLLSEADMIHYLDVMSGWNEDLCKCWFDRAVSQRAWRALSIKNLEDFRCHLRKQQPRCILAADPDQQHWAHYEYSKGAAVKALQEGRRIPPEEQFAWKAVRAPGVCAESMLLEWMAEPRHVLSGGLEKAHAEGRGGAGETHGEGKGSWEASFRKDNGRRREEEAGNKVARRCLLHRLKQMRGVDAEAGAAVGGSPPATATASIDMNRKLVPLERSNDPLVWEEWPAGDEDAVKFPVNRKERCFGLGIVEERGEAAGKLTEHPSQHTSEAGRGSRRAKEEGSNGEGQGSQEGEWSIARGIAEAGGGSRSARRKVTKAIEKGAWEEVIKSRARERAEASRNDEVRVTLPPPRRKLPIVRCQADVDFLLGFAGYAMDPPACTHCRTCASEYKHHVCTVALIANFAYRPVSHLFSRVLSVFPPSSPGFDEVVACLDLPARLPRPLNLHMLLRRAEQVPLYVLIHMAASFAHYLLGTDEIKNGSSGRGHVEQCKVQGRWDGEADQENGGEVWEEEQRGSAKGSNSTASSSSFWRDGSSSFSKRIGKQRGEPAYVKAWPGGVNLVACLREMLLGEPCYRPASAAAPSIPAAVSIHAAADAPDVQRRVCSTGCGRVEGGGVKLKSCGGCGKVAYCSRECQKAHWPSHKLTCPGRSNGKRSGKNSSKVGGWEWEWQCGRQCE
ncbi:unnamed protein product [Closterium sp. Naga37s-1]|nr:unnamed protein product [Closterium sp. Naga37s-1]